MSKMCRVISICMAVFLLMLCPLSYSFAASSALESLVIDEIIEMAWNTLVGWGIQIGEEYVYTTNQWLFNEINTYINTELNQTWDAWISLIQFARDPWGRGTANNYFLETMWDFTEWLTNKYHWGNNDQYQVGATYSIGDLTVYELPLYLICNDTGSGFYQGWQTYWYEGVGTPYVVFRDNNGTLNAYIFSTGGFTYHIQNYAADGSASQTRDITVDVSARITGTSSSAYTSIAVNHGVTLKTNSNPGLAVYDYDTITSALNAYTVRPVGGIPVITYDITLPGDSPEYQEGYSIIYYPDGSVGYLDINWPDRVTVGNLPVAIMPSSVGNDLNFTDTSAPINGFARQYSEGVGLITSILYQLPSPLIGMALAIIASTIVFGAIHAFKEH